MDQEELQHKVKDIGLWERGRKEMDLAEVEMPGLMQIREEMAESRPLEGARITGSLHMTIQTAVLIETLHACGTSAIRWASCNIYSTQDQAAAAIVQAGTANVFAWKQMSLEDYWWCTLQALTFPGGKGPNLIVDDGGDATMMIQLGQQFEIQYEKDKTLPDPNSAESSDEKALLEFFGKVIPTDVNRFRKLGSELKGISEETTTGVLRLYQLEEKRQLMYPAMNVNDSVTKSKFDNVYGCRHSLPDAIMRSTDVMIAGKKVVICGYGDVGKGCAQAMQRCAARVYVTEVDPICALQALMEGISVQKLDDIIAEVDIIITATGNKGILSALQMSKMKNNAIVGNIGHFDNEIDMNGLENWPGIKKINIKEQLDRYVFPDGHGVLVMAEGRLCNLGCATGHPSFVMSNSFCNQVLAQVELWKEKDTGKYGKHVYVLPKHLDEKVAQLHLRALGGELETLTKEQADYIGVPVKGPFKKDEYRY